MYRLTKDRGEGDTILFSAVSPIRDAKFAKIEYEFRYPSLYVVVQILNYYLQKRSRYLRAVLFWWAILCLDCVIGMSKNQGIYPFSSRSDLKSTFTIIHDFSFRDWSVFFCVLLTPVEDVLSTIFFKGDLLSSLSGIVQPVRKGRLDTGSWTVECSRQCIDRDWDIVTRFCNILHECNLPASKFKSSKIPVSLS
jgi:hypothetical protein